MYNSSENFMKNWSSIKFHVKITSILIHKVYLCLNIKYDILTNRYTRQQWMYSEQAGVKK